MKKTELTKNQKSIYDKVIANGVKSLSNFGYADCTVENIMTDSLFKPFFARIVENTLLDDNLSEDVEIVLNLLLEELK